MVLPLQNVVKEYAWGSRTAIAELLGQPSPSPTPQAELWMGAHPGGPSRAGSRPLPELIAADPDAMLGSRVVRSLGPELPFLLKILAAGEPLSLQAHPTRAQAQAGFDAEQRAGIPIEAKHRCYKDANHKPELLCALTRFEALCGFRAVRETARLFEALAEPALAGVAERLRASDDAEGVRAAFTWLMEADRTTQERLVEATLGACRRCLDRGGSSFAVECSWALRLGRHHPGDVGVISSLLLNLVKLDPGEAIYLPAGNLHAYLEGTGVEIMASSDNVLRGGLTAKHVNVPELLHVLDFAPLTPASVLPRRAGNELVYDAPAAEFRLSCIELDGGSWSAAPQGPEIVVATRGELTIDGGPATLPRGSAAFVPASTARYELSGTGTAFRATVP